MMLEENMILILVESDGKLKVKSAKEVKRLFKLSRKVVYLPLTS